MVPPALAEALADAARRSPRPAAVAALVGDLRRELGPDRVHTVEAARRAASTDFAYLSPILSAVLPSRPADVVVRPGTVAQVCAAIRLAHRHGVPITPRGAGTGNYGQAVPLAAGMVLDLTACDRIAEVGEGFVRAETGATFVELVAAARRHGQEPAMVPTTVGSTLGGFLAGGAGGVGSLEHGFLWDGLVSQLEIVSCPPDDHPSTVVGDRCAPYLHAYGVSGVIVGATIGLVPRRERTAVLASFPTDGRDMAVQAGVELMDLASTPRQVSLDEPAIVAALPPDPYLPVGRFSLRALVEDDQVAQVTRIVGTHGGRVDGTRGDGTRHGAERYLATLAFNHITVRVRRTRPDICHLQVSGDALTTRTDEVRQTLPEAMLHLDGVRVAAGRRGFTGLLLSRFVDVAMLYRGITELEELGVRVVDPHTWLLGGPGLTGVRAAAIRNDPDGLLNPGKLPPA